MSVQPAIARDIGLGLFGFACGAIGLLCFSAAQAEPARAAALRAAAGEPARLARSDTGSGITRADDGLFYVQARVNGAPVRFLVDTGATHVTLTAADARRIGVMPPAGARPARLVTAGGATAMTWTRLAHVGIAGHEASDVRAAIVHSGLDVSLLGQNMLAQLGPIAIDGNRLRIG